MRTRTFLVLTVLVVAMLTVQIGFGQALPADKCNVNGAATPPTYYLSPDIASVAGATTIKTLAAASNFDGPARSMAQSFANTQTTTAVVVCSNSTGVLEQKILANPTAYDYFFAADEMSDDFLDTIEEEIPYTPFLYAYGVPVIFGYNSSTGNYGSVNAATALISGCNGTGCTFSGNVGTVSGSASVGNLSLNIASTPIQQMVAIADPNNAPYGEAACNILKDMGALSSSTVCTPPISIPSPPAWYSTFGNVTLAFGAVGTSPVKSGFVGRSQICVGGTGSVRSDVAYVEFPGYRRVQNALQITSNGSALNTYIQGQMYTAWNTFLSNNCYDPIP